MFKLYLDPNHSIRSISNELDLIGIRTRKGRPFSKSFVQRILKNPFYIGINRFDGKDYPGAQEPIISNELFNKVQAKMRAGRPVRLKKHNPVLKNIIHCDNCGGVITWQKQKGKYYGNCQRNKKICSGKKFLREDKVEEVIMDQLQKLVCPSDEIIDWVANTMLNEKEMTIENRDRIFNSINLQLKKLKHMDDELYDDKLAGDISKEKYDAKHAQFIEQIAGLETQKNKMDVTIAKGMEQRIVIFELAQKAAKIYSKKTPEQKRLIITKLFSDISSNNGLVSVKYTNFSRAIADNVLKTSNFLGGKI